MPSYPLSALVLRKTKLGETDMIVTLLSRDGRQVRAVAKGVRKPGSRFGGRLEPYSTVDLLLHTGRSLEVVSDARLVNARSALVGDYDRSAAAAVVVDVLDKFAVEGQTEPRLFGLAEATLDRFESGETGALPRLVAAFLLKALAMHGYRPELAGCVACGGDVSTARAFSLAAGGALCGECAESAAGALDVAPEALAWLDVLLGSTMAEVAALEMPDQAAMDCFALVRSFVAYHVPARLKALDLYAATLLWEAP